LDLSTIALFTCSDYFGMTMTSAINPETKAKLDALAAEIAQASNEAAPAVQSEQELAEQRAHLATIVDRVLVEDAELLQRLADA
jgi:predicted transcriptional regulator